MALKRAFVIRCMDCPPEMRPRGRAGPSGCGLAYDIYTGDRRGQFKCKECGKRQRVTLNGGGSAAFVSGPYDTRREAALAAECDNLQRGTA
jgi:hypothetical protein